MTVAGPDAASPPLSSGFEGQSEELTDNGNEFTNPVAIEFDEENNRWINLFHNDWIRKIFEKSCGEFLRNVL
jgi:hypothetical protein